MHQPGTVPWEQSCAVPGFTIGLVMTETHRTIVPCSRWAGCGGGPVILTLREALEDAVHAPESRMTCMSTVASKRSSRRPSCTLGSASTLRNWFS